MAAKLLSADGTWNTGLQAECQAGYRTLVYSGSLGGGTLQVFTTIDGVTSPVPDSKLSAANVDGNGDAIKQIVFASSGNISVVLSGATAPSVTLGVA